MKPRRAQAPLHVSALAARIVLGWLLALQPLVLGFASAAQLGGLDHGIICRGLPKSEPQQPNGPADDHAACCLAGCLGTADVPKPVAALPVPGRAPEAAPSRPLTAATSPWRAGLGPQAARAPPHRLST